jgi:radical SAM superfamily enzyme YgiQ (UPF0313 family)
VKAISRKNLLDAETGTSYKGEGIPVGLIYPNTYFVGMSNLGFQVIYSELNKIAGVSCERIFLSEPILSLERGKVPASFEILAFSISFELDYLNVLKILDFSGIPLRSSERGDSYPLVIAGGFAPSSNPEPLASFVDVFLIGEGEEIIVEFMGIYKHLRGRANRRELLKELAGIRGVYVPGIDSRGLVERRWLKNLDGFDTASRILTPNTEFGNMFMVEITRGCPGGCRFCLAGSVCKPFRVRSSGEIMSLVSRGLKNRRRIGLVSLETSSYPYLDEVLEGILSMGGVVSLSSLLPGGWHKSILSALKKSGQKTIAVAPEAGSEKLRKAVGKDFCDEEIIEQLEKAVEAGIKHIKLYFLAGLPGETNGDIEALINFVGKLRLRCKKAPKITVSVNPFIPKPGTPFQWMPMEEEGILSSRIRMIKDGIRKLPGVNLIHESVKWSLWQGVLSRGDRKTGDILQLAYEMGGDWRKAFRKAGIEPDFYLREREKEEPLPWDYLIHTNKRVTV